MKKKNYYIKSDFIKNIIKLLTTSSVAQLIPLLITPILTQYFTAEDFGTYGLYISICTILGIIAAGRYDVAIMLPKKNKDALNIVAICFLITSIFSIICFIILEIFKIQLFDLTKSEIFNKHYFLIPITIFLFSINQTLIVWFNRQKKYTLIGEHNLLKSSTNSFYALVLGLKKISTGMIIGNIISLIITVIFNIYDFISSTNYTIITTKSVYNNFKKYIVFLKYSTFSNLFNSLSNIGMTALIALFFGIKVAGFYFLAERIISIPISILTSSISQVYFQEASFLYHKNKKALLILTNDIQKKIFIFLLPFLLILSFWGENLFSLFGNEWSESGLIIKYFSIFILFKNIYSPISTIGDILKKQKLLLMFNLSLFLFQVASFYFLKEIGNINYALLLSSSIGAIHYIILSIYMKRKIITND